jgi:Protein of unknown function (DUF1275)
MNVFPAEIRQMIIPDRGGAYGPLPPLLVAMTVVTGLVDAFSYLVLGHVFVANMTGNVVFLAFALAGAGGFSLPAVVVALTPSAWVPWPAEPWGPGWAAAAGSCSAPPPQRRPSFSPPRW